MCYSSGLKLRSLKSTNYVKPSERQRLGIKKTEPSNEGLRQTQKNRIMKKLINY